MSIMSFAAKPVLEGRQVRLRPIEERDLDDLWVMLGDEEGRRLTGTHAGFTREVADNWYRTRGAQDDRLDLVVATSDEDRCVGEVVLNHLDVDNAACGFRISLAGPAVFGKGYGTEATRLVLGHAFDTVGLHRVELEVYDHNPRARHVYERVGFVVEGRRREALRWEGRYHDAILMGLLAHEWREASPSTA